MKSIKIVYTLLLFGLTCVASAKAEKPNVVLFFIDDLGYMDLACYGSKFYETPNLDRLAARSARFTDAYSANPVCSPTRAALMTGKAPQRMGITQWIPQPNEKHLSLYEVTFAEAFQEAGYQTGYIGKWHLGEKDHQMPNAQGFQWMRCVNRAGQPASYFHPYSGRQREGVAYWDVPDLDDATPDDYLTDKMTDFAIDFIDENREQPFLLCFAHYAVHTPIQSPKELVSKYQEKRKARFSDSANEYGDERNDAKSRTRQDDAAYAAMIENLDTNVGRVLDHLQKNNLQENTIIVFTSDNGGLSTTRRGGPTSVRPLRAGKGWTYEGGIRIPLMIAAPKVEPHENDTPAITMDLYPTLLELAGLPTRPQQHLDGMSLLSTLTNSEQVSNDRIMAWYYPHNHGSGHTPSSAIRKDNWKLIHLLDQDRFELYDLANDIGETDNVADEYADRVKEMSKELSEWIAETTLKN